MLSPPSAWPVRRMAKQVRPVIKLGGAHRVALHDERKQKRAYISKLKTIFHMEPIEFRCGEQLRRSIASSVEECIGEIIPSDVEAAESISSDLEVDDYSPPLEPVLSRNTVTEPPVTSVATPVVLAPKPRLPKHSVVKLNMLRARPQSAHRWNLDAEISKPQPTTTVLPPVLEHPARRKPALDTRIEEIKTQRRPTTVKTSCSEAASSGGYSAMTPSTRAPSSRSPRESTSSRWSLPRKMPGKCVPIRKIESYQSEERSRVRKAVLECVPDRERKKRCHSPHKRRRIKEVDLGDTFRALGVAEEALQKSLLRLDLLEMKRAKAPDGKEMSLAQFAQESSLGQAYLIMPSVTNENSLLQSLDRINRLLVCR